MSPGASELVVTILGCGSSGGVPRVGQGWGRCDPNNPRNRRRRCSILVQRFAPPAGGGIGSFSGPDSSDNAGPTTVLVDMSPDLREQLIAADCDALDAILVTHSHADHTHGIDDVRPLVIKHHRRIQVQMDAFTSGLLQARFEYIFRTPAGSQYPPLLDWVEISHGHVSDIAGAGGVIEAIPFRLDHGDIDALGFRFGKIAYTPDVVGIPDESVQYLEDLDVWIIDALRYRPHPSHFSLEQALSWIERMKPKRAILTNLHTDMDFDQLCSELPDGVEPAYDGMRVRVGI